MGGQTKKYHMLTHGKIDKPAFGVSMYSLTLFSSINRSLRTPVIASLLQNRRFAIVIIIAACMQTALAVCGLNGWLCPFRSILGVPCPGCGLSTAIAHLMLGDWTAALHAHLFAPVVLLGFVIMAGISVLPERYHAAAVSTIEKYEKASGFMAILLAAMILYWGVRLVYLI